ncbi:MULTISPECIES: GNAT family N-acetyltransferase [Micromonospora]|uniref:GNAT family N-acetyltransferase n=1 Tax=Micromonospora chalcea TaxID=1874 RepID=A0ABX9Y7U0_MICCH|nr:MULTISPECIES: GNAT family N-acetyltransferase [Micromonospora]MBC8993321.1 GNAT family N-acetyltransferase [Micromonospora chalcea]MCK1810088.1 GNAT family N-acetyltransferase [Micromonospora sp. R42106]MCK1835239.1 GNAT family N-acetyltransferase [Micromonospora sp. R42003]MCK1847154.1 GNAT family N-acetyltransferase [Micromonospora sp. R42004]MCM1016759.1 GNAT family N-acetyltransferase [Micromonospora sp. XM-20-01]
MDVEIIELGRDRLPEVVELCRVSLDLPEDAVEASAVVVTVAERAGADRPVLRLGAVRDGALIGVLVGSLSAADPRLGHVDLIAVAPPERRQGVGGALLAEAESRLGALGAAEVLLAGNPPHYAWPGIDVRYTPAVCAAQRLGYRQDRTAWNMTADLSEGSVALRRTEAAERRLAGRGVTVRRATPDDLPALAAFARSTFGGTWDGELAGSVGRPDAGVHLAERDGEILGFAAYGSARPSWFGPMGTAPAAEGSGIGGVLLRRCLRDQAAAGITAAQIGWVGPVPFYSNAAGARIERVFFLYRKAIKGA